MRGFMVKMKDKLYYYFAEKNWGVRQEYGPYVDANQDDHAKHPWRYRWLLVRLNWHYRILRRTDTLCYTKPRATKSRLPYLDGAESEISDRYDAIHFAHDLLQYDVVSFDIFDTLILRPFAKPNALFMIVGKRLNIMEFHSIRTDAEKQAREMAAITKGNREVTIFDIYDLIEQRTGLPKETGVQAEIQAEFDYCFANPYMQKVYRLLKEQEKKIVITSDMYLPMEIMEQLLSRNGYAGYERLYVSCDYGCSKSSKSLYQYVKRDFEGQKIIHVGDNSFSDIKCAEESGITAYYYKNVHEIGAPYRADGMSALIDSAYAGVVNTHLHNSTEVYSPYYEYGFLYGGLYVFGFCNWIQCKAKKERIEKILFLARDGAIYQKVYRKYFGEVPDEYFLWSRIANTKYTLKKNRGDFLKRIVRDRSYSVNKSSISSVLMSLNLKLLEKYLPDYGLAPDTLVVPETVNTFEKLFIEHWEESSNVFETEKLALREYLCAKIGSAKSVAIIDVGWFGSGPMGLKYLIEDEFGLDCKVHCWQAAARSPMHAGGMLALMDDTIEPYIFSEMYNRNHFDTHKNSNHGLNNIFFEMFTQDTTPSYSGMTETENFVFDIPEVENYQVVREIHSGILSFCELYFNRFQKDPFVFNISGYDAYCPFRMIIRDSKFIKTYFSDLTFSRGVSGDYSNQRTETLGEIFEQVRL